MRGRRICWSVSLVVAAGCAVPVRIVSPFDDTEVTIDRLVADLATADVVVFGESHGTATLHQEHQRILRALQARRPDLVIAMEMFERDVQPVLSQYLLGYVDESEFLARSRPWSNYAADYRPVIEFARERHLEVLAANAPSAAAAQVARDGIGALERSPHVARTTSAPDDDYRAAFLAAMRTHPDAAGSDHLERYYQAQCLKDDTMAETVVDRLQELRREQRRPLAVLFCGHLHSDHRRGVVARLLAREPDFRVKVFGVEPIAPEQAGTIAAGPTLADYVLLVPEIGDEDDVETVAVASSTATPAPSPAAPAHDRAKTAPSAGGEQGGRPGLGFMPDYQSGVAGCVVADVIEGGAAAAAGIEPGDVIVEFDGVEVDSVRSYADELARCTIGQHVDVVVLRGKEQLKLPVVVGRSNR